jgi:hypothetical protein
VVKTDFYYAKGIGLNFKQGGMKIQTESSFHKQGGQNSNGKLRKSILFLLFFEILPL